MTSPRGSAEHGGEHAASLAALAAKAVIGNQLRLPEARCEGGACGARFEDAMALGEGDLRSRAIAAGWREDQTGLLTCPACQQRAPWPDAFRRGRRAAHAPEPAQQPVDQRPAGRRRADPGQAARQPVPAQQPMPAPPPASAGAAAWQPPASGWPDPAPDGEVPPRDQAFSAWETWRAG